ncbi:MAG: (d)CMP kinase [Chloroflexi bacterium]|nr:(d)CMP kinase [Chloroflexota bacterium]
MSAPAARGPIVTIDGPAAVGKTTVGRMLAESLGYLCLDSGLFYRAVALATVRADGDPDSADDALAAARSLRLRFAVDPSGRFAARAFNGDCDITEALISPEVDRTVSLVSRIPAVRAAMLEPQREALREGDIVALGRDIGTVVCPEADLKVYLDASPDVRARRRWKERRDAGGRMDIADIHENLLARDRIDSQRSIAPLRAASDAVIISTDACAPAEVVEAIRASMTDRGLIHAA